MVERQPVVWQPQLVICGPMLAEVLAFDGASDAEWADAQHVAKLRRGQ
jgi:hypothetical protein